MTRSLHSNAKRILIVDTNTTFRERLAQLLREKGYEAVTTASGESAFHVLRDWNHPVDGFFSRATLPGLMDGWILADEYRDSHPHRSAVIAVSDDRVSAQGHVVLKEPSPADAFDAIRGAATMRMPSMSPAAATNDQMSLAA